MEVKEEKDITWATAKKLLEAREKEKELGYEQKNALEHLKKFSKLSEKKANDMMTELEKVERLKENQRINIVNMLPQDLEDLRVIFANEVTSLSDADKKKIISIVKKYS